MWAASEPPTRTRSSCRPRSSRSPTAWAGPRPARWPPRWPSPLSRANATRASRPRAQLARILRDANRRIYDLAVADESRRGMGTTLTLAKVHGDAVSLAHVGDSRAYRLREGEPQQLTRDHSLVAELERSGQISPEAAEHHPQRSIITRALGPEPDVEVDTYTIAGREGDMFLICSDGLTAHGLGRRAVLDPAVGRGPRAGRRRARAGREPERRQGQHHRDPVPARRVTSRRPGRHDPAAHRPTRTRSSA